MKLSTINREFPYSPCSYTCIASHLINILHQSGTFVTTDELTLTSHNHSKSKIYISVHCWCCILHQSVSSVAQLCLTLGDPMDCSMQGFPVHHQLPKLAQAHVHWVGDTIQLSADGDCSHEIKRRLLLRRKTVANLDSILKSRDITLPSKVCLVKAMVFPVVMYGCEGL